MTRMERFEKLNSEIISLEYSEGRVWGGGLNNVRNLVMSFVKTCKKVYFGLFRERKLVPDKRYERNTLFVFLRVRKWDFFPVL